MSLLSNLRTTCHLVLSVVALYLAYATTKPLDPSLRVVSSEERSLRGRIYVFASTTLAALFALRAEDIFQSEEEVLSGQGRREDEELRRGKEWLEGGVELNGFMYWAAVLFLTSPSSSTEAPLLLLLAFIMNLFFLGSFLLHVVLTAMHSGTKGSTVDRLNGEKSFPTLLDLETSGSAVVPPVAVVVEEESKETLADVASLSFLVGWSFLCLITSLALTFLYKTDSLASLFILPSALTISCIFFPRHHHRTPLILVTSINLILHSFARASYSLLYVSNVRPVCAIFLLHDPALGITPHLPMECKLSRMLYFVSLLALVGLIARSGVLYSTPTKGKMLAPLEKERAGARE